MFSHFTTSTCILCHSSTHSTLCLCSHCLNDFPLMTHSCPQCGNALSTKTSGLCGSCQKHPPSVDKTFSLFHYKTPVDHLIKQLKFNHSIIPADLFGKLMAKAIAQQNITLPDALIPIPLHSNRIRERGFNQAIEIARPLAKAFKIPLINNRVIRSKHTRPQTDCSAKERSNNLKNSFNCITPLPYQRVAIIDDVISTGTTINEVAKILKQQGVKEVYAWSCAHS